MKKIVGRILAVIAVLSSFLIWTPLRAQNPQFKIGDAVDAVFYDGKWYPARVTARAGCGGTCGAYTVTEIAGKSSWIVYEGPTNIRAHGVTATEKSEQDAVQIELTTRAYAGNGIGAQYGVREPTTCPSRKAAPTTPAIAKQYVLCDAEGFDGIQNVNILSDVVVQVAGSRGFIYTRDSGDNQIDVRAPLYDIRGSYKQYQCGRPRKGSGDYIEAHNCMFYDQPEARGTCYRDTFGDWHCVLLGNRLGSTGVDGAMAPR
jgi:hypothetical protein